MMINRKQIKIRKEAVVTLRVTVDNLVEIRTKIPPEYKSTACRYPNCSRSKFWFRQLEEIQAAVAQSV
jgi:hypothetical protein